jgi:hypothetical protein
MRIPTSARDTSQAWLLALLFAAFTPLQASAQISQDGATNTIHGLDTNTAGVRSGPGGGPHVKVLDGQGAPSSAVEAKTNPPRCPQGQAAMLDGKGIWSCQPLK